MNWEQQHLFNGAGFLMNLIYVQDAWRLGNALGPEHGDPLKETAATLLVYGLILEMVDGAKCADASAAAHRRDQLVVQNSAVIQYLKSLPKSKRIQFASFAVDFERATSAVRPNDDALCSGGLSEMIQGLQESDPKLLSVAAWFPWSRSAQHCRPMAPRWAPPSCLEAPRGRTHWWKPPVRTSRSASRAHLVGPEAEAPQRSRG